jgi:hypothetical protein
LEAPTNSKTKEYHIRKPLHQRSYVQNFEALSLAIPEKLNGSFFNELTVHLAKSLTFFAHGSD